MNTLITDNVVTDLWLLEQAGEASADSRALVRSYTESRPDLRARLEAGRSLPAFQPKHLSPNAEMLALENAREKARHKMILIGVGMAMLAVTVLAALGGAMFLFMSRG